MAGFQPVNLGQVVAQAEQIQNARTSRGLAGKQENRLQAAFEQSTADRTATAGRAAELARVQGAAIGGGPEALADLARMDPAAANRAQTFNNSQRPAQPDFATMQGQRAGFLGVSKAARGYLDMAERVGFISRALESFPDSPLKQGILEDIADGIVTDAELDSFDQSMIGLQEQAEPEKPNTRDQQFSALVAAGVPEDRARGISSGRLELRTDPISGAMTVVDLGDSPVTTLGGATPADDLVVPADEFVNPIPQEGVRDLSAGTGPLEQSVKGAINSILQFGGADPLFPGQVTSSTAIQNLGRDTALALSTVPGGRTSNLRYQAFLETQPDTFSGEAQARSRVRETIDAISNRIGEASQFANDPSADRTIRRTAQQQIGELRRLRDGWVELVEGGSEQPNVIDFGDLPDG